MALQGLCVAFSAAPLDSSPTWTRIDNITGVAVQRISIKRGRPDERSKTDTGTMEVTAVDYAGKLDATNASSPYAGTLDPDKQIGYALLNPHTSTYSILYRGFVASWAYDLTTLDKSALYTQVTIDCKDALQLTSDAEIIPDGAGNTVPAESEGDVYYDPVTVTRDRILAAIADTANSCTDFSNPYDTDWPADQLDLFTGNVKLKGAVYSSQTPLLQVIDEAADAEFPGVANRYVSKDGKITFHGRLARFDPTNPTYGINSWKLGDVAAFNADSTVAVISELGFDRSDENIINAALSTPKDIANADISGQFVSDPTSIGFHGARSISFDNLLTDGRSDGTTTALEETKLFATYYVDNYKDPQNRINKIVIRPQPVGSAFGPNVWDFICGVEISDLVHVKTTHPGGGGFDDDFFVEGIEYEIVPMNGTNPEVTLTLDVSPRALYDTDPF